MKHLLKKRREGLDDKILNVTLYVLVFIIMLICVYPVYFVIIASFSDANIVYSGKFLLTPQGFHTGGYKYVFANQKLLIGYANTILYTVCGTLLGLLCSFPAGYALSRKDLPGRGLLMRLMVFTMYFEGGLIPLFLVVKKLNMLDTRAILIILGSVSVYNIILIRSFCESNITQDLREATLIDGCGDFRFFVQFVVPLSKAIIAVIALYLAVSYWNSYYNALLYIQDPNKKPLQLFIREMLMSSSGTSAGGGALEGEAAGEYMKMIMVVKYAVIVVATVPIMCVYPFIQKYFVKGVMIGSVKG